MRRISFGPSEKELGYITVNKWMKQSGFDKADKEADDKMYNARKSLVAAYRNYKDGLEAYKKVYKILGYDKGVVNIQEKDTRYVNELIKDKETTLREISNAIEAIGKALDAYHNAFS